MKLPRLSSWTLFLGCLLANLQERTFAATRWPELCPVCWALPGGWLLVMRRARPLTDAEWKALDPEAWCNRPDYTVPVEPKRDSFGVLEGRLVAVDYGS